MYMRGWRGPGHAYPLDVMETVGDPPLLAISEGLMKISSLINSIPEVGKLLNNLITVEMGDQITVRRGSMRALLKDVSGDQMCIRQASTIFIGTAAHYLKLLTGESTGVDASIQTIS